MRIASASIIALTAGIAVVQAQTDQSASSAEPVRTYTLLGEDEDWSFLKDPSLRQDIWDPVKYIALGTDGWYLSIGGGMREAFEQACHQMLSLGAIYLVADLSALTYISSAGIGSFVRVAARARQSGGGRQRQCQISQRQSAD